MACLKGLMGAEACKRYPTILSNENARMQVYRLPWHPVRSSFSPAYGRPQGTPAAAGTSSRPFGLLKPSRSTSAHPITCRSTTSSSSHRSSSSSSSHRQAPLHAAVTQTPAQQRNRDAAPHIPQHNGNPHPGHSNDHSYDHEFSHNNHTPVGHTPLAGMGLSSAQASPIMCGSHTPMMQPTSSLECYGCYRVTGPAVIVKRGHHLEAHLYNGAKVEFFDGDTTLMFTEAMISQSIMSMDSTRSDLDDPYPPPPCICQGTNLLTPHSTIPSGTSPPRCTLQGQHVELCGSFEIPGGLPLGGHLVEHDGKCVLTVGSLDSDVVIVLSMDGQLSHPVNVQPPRQH